MIFKIILYFSLDILFYGFMITSTTTIGFYLFYLLMGLSVLLTAFNISHDAAHGVAVKSKFWNKLLFSLSFNLQGNNAYVWGKNNNEMETWTNRQCLFKLQRSNKIDTKYYRQIRIYNLRLMKT